MENLADPVLDDRLAALDVEASLADENTVLEVLVALVAGLFLC